MDKKEREKRLNSHKWSGWPVCWCLLCDIDDPLEIAVADNIEDTDQWDCPECPGKDKNENKM
jgi:hypothetical protein